MLSHRHPLLYNFAVTVYRIKRRIEWLFDSRKFASTYKRADRLEHNVKRHSSRLIKQLGNTDLKLQHNKVENIKLCLPYIDGLVIAPGESFSFCRLIGLPTRKRGFMQGLELSMGKAQEGVGGGICQIANVLNWLVLHSPLTVTERSTHSFDPFPDQNRSIPFGTGCAIFYNYVDFCFTNETEFTFHLSLQIEGGELKGHLTSDQMINHTYKIFEKNHHFSKEDNTFYRHNEIWRRVMKRPEGSHLLDEHIKTNHVRVMYTPLDNQFAEQDAPSNGGQRPSLNSGFSSRRG
jgi:vancomycin resistance protein VanW